MKTRDLRIESIRPLISPVILLEELPLTEAESIVVSQTRDQLVRILDGEDDRLIVVVGPCSIHDPEAGLEYGRRLKRLADELEDDLCVVMRVYFEKPRTTVGWKGFINDPHLDGSCRTNEGLRLGRKLLLDLLEIGMPAGCEFLDPISPQFISDLMVWGAIGARTTESQVHRQLASGLSCRSASRTGRMPGSGCHRRAASRRASAQLHRRDRSGPGRHCHHARQRGHPRHPARRRERPQLRPRQCPDGAVGCGARAAAAPHHDRHQPR